MKLQRLHRMIASVSLLLTAALVSYGAPAASRAAATPARINYQDHIQPASQGGGFIIAGLGLPWSRKSDLSAIPHAVTRVRATAVCAQGRAVTRVAQLSQFQLPRVVQRKWASKRFASGQIGLG